jgi:hypothetical protein
MPLTPHTLPRILQKIVPQQSPCVAPAVATGGLRILKGTTDVVNGSRRHVRKTLV